MFPFTKTAPNAMKQQANQLYGRAVTQARDPRFYRDLGVQDTPDGRLALVSLHVYLLLSRLQDGEDHGQALSQELVDLFVDDLDQAMRELGIGDMGVGRRVKKAMAQFFDMAHRMNAALSSDEPGLGVQQELMAFVPGLTLSQPSAGQLGAYVRAAHRHLTSIPLDRFADVSMLFPTLDNPENEA